MDQQNEPFNAVSKYEVARDKYQDAIIKIEPEFFDSFYSLEKRLGISLPIKALLTSNQ